MNKVLILSDGKLIGPFPDQATAASYCESHTLGTTELYSIWQPAEGTADIAHECGARLLGIDEVTPMQRAGRRATGA